MKNYLLGLLSGVMLCALVWVFFDKSKFENEPPGVVVTVETTGARSAAELNSDSTLAPIIEQNAEQSDLMKEGTDGILAVDSNTGSTKSKAQASAAGGLKRLEDGALFEPDDEFMQRYLQQERAKQAGALIADLSKRVALLPSTAMALSEALETKLAADQALMMGFANDEESAFNPELYNTPESALNEEQIAKLERMNQETTNMLAQQELAREEFAARVQSELSSEQLEAFRSLERERASSAKTEMTDLMVNGMLKNIPNLNDYQRDEVLRLKGEYLTQPVGDIPLGSTVNTMSLFGGDNSGDDATRFFEQMNQVLTPEQQQSMQEPIITDMEF